MSAFENDIRRIRTLVVITSRSELERGLILLKAGLVTVEEVQNWIDANWNYTNESCVAYGVNNPDLAKEWLTEQRKKRDIAPT